MEIKWTKKAANNLETILSYIASDNPAIAKEFLAHILAQVMKLEDFPLLGRSGMVVGTRELVIHENYILFYKIKNEVVEILRILHARRKYP